MKKNYKVINVKSEAIDCVSLKLSSIDDKNNLDASYKAGQYVVLGDQIKGEDVYRSYSLSSAPYEGNHYTISVKAIPNGKMSNHLVKNISSGDLLSVSKPAGSFVCSDNTDLHVFFAAGSGVTPIFSMIKYILKETKQKVCLVYSGQNRAHTMFVQELQDLKSEYEERFYLFFCFSKEVVTAENLSRDTGDFNSKLDRSLFESVFLKMSSKSMSLPVYYLCGPDLYMKNIESYLSEKGVDGSQIRTESFTASVVESRPGVDSKDSVLVAGSGGVQGECEQILFDLDESRGEVKPQKDETLLDSLLREGENVPFSCMEGTCMACQCKITEGQVKMPDHVLLNESDIEDGIILSCQALPLTKKVKIDFDMF